MPGISLESTELYPIPAQFFVCKLFCRRINVKKAMIFKSA